ncbi:ribonuclease E inhibitor RraB [Orbus wheelerorum]|uniref:ribonuclease E inhibitor RraB n=1 Tax=Orbus wheelerorum TaxID=3074111 RepID=UPI00370DC266
MKKQIELAQQDTYSIIEELLNDGSDPDALYLIEHHISATDFDTLEKVAVEAFKLGYEVTDPEDMDDENEQELVCCDVIAEIPLDGEVINAQIAQLIELTNKFSVNYDGWGTYFEDGEDVDDEFEDDETIKETFH